MSKPALPADKVSRNAKVVAKCDGRAGMLIVRHDGGSITISCGWAKSRTRAKAREDMAQNHIDKEHYGGQAIWL